MRIALRAGTAADGERLARRLVTAGVGDDVGAVAVRQQDHVGRPPRRGRRHLKQVRQRADPHRTRAGPVREPPGEQDLAVRRDHDAGAARHRLAGAGGQRLGGGLIGAKLLAWRAASAQATSHSYDRSTGVSGTETVAVTTGRMRPGRAAGHAARCPAEAEPEKRKRDRRLACHRPITAGGHWRGNTGVA